MNSAHPDTSFAPTLSDGSHPLSLGGRGRGGQSKGSKHAQLSMVPSSAALTPSKVPAAPTAPPENCTYAPGAADVSSRSNSTPRKALAVQIPPHAPVKQKPVAPLSASNASGHSFPHIIQGLKKIQRIQNHKENTASQNCKRKPCCSLCIWRAARPYRRRRVRCVPGRSRAAQGGREHTIPAQRLGNITVRRQAAAAFGC